MAVGYIADACALIAYHGYGGRAMSARGREIMRTEDVLVSPVTVWEITRKVAAGKLDAPIPPGFRGGLVDFLRLRGYRLVPFGWEEAEHANRLPWHHQDPMDRMLIATALLRDLPIITSDAVFARYGVAPVW